MDIVISLKYPGIIYDNEFNIICNMGEYEWMILEAANVGQWGLLGHKTDHTNEWMEEGMDGWMNEWIDGIWMRTNVIGVWLQVLTFMVGWGEFVPGIITVWIYG